MQSNAKLQLIIKCNKDAVNITCAAAGILKDNFFNIEVQVVFNFSHFSL